MADDALQARDWLYHIPVNILSFLRSEPTFAEHHILLSLVSSSNERAVPEANFPLFIIVPIVVKRFVVLCSKVILATPNVCDGLKVFSRERPNQRLLSFRHLVQQQIGQTRCCCLFKL